MVTQNEATIVDDQPRAKRRNTKRLALLALLLLPVAVLANLKTVIAVARGERTIKGVIYGLAPGDKSEFGNVPIPENIGNKDAKVTIEVFVRGGDSCHAPTLFLGEALWTVYPERVRVVFRDTSQAEGAKRSVEVKLVCEQGIAVNGKVKYDLPNDGKSGERVTYLTGGHEQHWQPRDLHYILDRELKGTYKGKGMAIGAEEFSQRLQDEQTRLMDAARQRAKDEKQGAKADAPPTDTAK